MQNKQFLTGILAAVMVVGSTFGAWADSPVVGPGVGTPGTINSGPGVAPILPPDQSQLPSIPGRVDYFSQPVSRPTVQVTDKYSYDQMVKDIQSLSNRYGNLMKTNVIGTSLDGRSIYEVIIGNPDAGKHVLIHAGIHAREYMTPLLVMKQLEYGLEYYSTGNYEGQPLSNIFNQVAIHYVPMANPDGTTISQFGISGIRSEQLRQTIQNCYATDLSLGRTSADFDRYLTYWKANGRGVDLNQNFPANWDQVSSSAYPSYATYKGTEALSEPESQALANLVNSRAWAATVSYHSMGDIIYWDYAGNLQYDRSNDLANLIAASTGYRPAGSSGNGGFKDWTQIKENPIAGVTIEVGRVACPIPISEYDRIWFENKMVWAAVAKYVMEH